LQAGFCAVWREAGAAWLLADGGGAIWLQRGGAAPAEELRLTSAGRPYRGRFTPRGLVRWRGEWLIVDGSDRLQRFGARGEWIGDRVLPTRASAITSSDRTLWLYNFLPTESGPRFWRSDDGVAFAAAAVPENPSAGESRAARALAAQLVLAGAPGGELYFSHLVGAPELRRLRGNAAVDVFSVAYSRSRRRAALEAFADGNFDPRSYSSPVADILVLPNGEVLVLRNREDVRAGGGAAGFSPPSSRSVVGLKPAAPPLGGLVIEVGRRLDRYSRDGAHLATAVLPDQGRWILGPASVLSPAGAVITAHFQKPMRGEVLP
jgi:hypothetical protein